MGAERDRDDGYYTGLGGWEKKNALLSQALALSKKCLIHYFPLRVSCSLSDCDRPVGRGHCGKGEGSALRGGGGGVDSVCVCVRSPGVVHSAQTPPVQAFL